MERKVKNEREGGGVKNLEVVNSYSGFGHRVKGDGDRGGYQTYLCID